MTSGSTVLSMNRDAICNAAARKIGAISLGNTLSLTEIVNASEALNNLVAEYMTLGMPLWARLDYTIPMVVGQSQYVIGVGQAVNTPFPLKVIQAWVVVTSGGTKQELMPNAIDNFNRLPLLQAAYGSPSQYMYQPFIDFGQFNVWPAPDSTTVSMKTLTISYMRPFDVFAVSTDTPYFPREWNNAIIYGLAALIAPEYGVPLNDRGSLQKEAEMHKELALDFGLENASLTFQPQEDWGRGFGHAHGGY